MGEEAPDGIEKSFFFPLLQVEGANFAGGGKVFAEDARQVSGFILHEPGFLEHLAANVANGENSDGNGQEAKKNEGQIAFPEGEVDQRPNGPNEGDRLLDEVVGNEYDPVLELSRVDDDSAYELSTLVLLEERERQNLELGKDHTAYLLEDPDAAVIDQVGIGKGTESTDCKGSGEDGDGKDENPEGRPLVLVPP